MAEKKAAKATAKKTEAKTPDQQFAIQRLYIKDSSFESPIAPAIFSEDWKPEMHLDIHTQSTVIEENLHEVVLGLTVTVKSEDKTAFLIEIKQAGLFAASGFPEEQLKHALGVFCPSVLYPYAREAVSAAVSRGGFPQLVLAPVNFEALYAQHQKQAAETKKEKEA